MTAGPDIRLVGGEGASFYAGVNAEPATPTSVYDLTRDALIRRFMEWGISPVHAAKLWYYLYYECVDSWDAMPELPPRVLARVREEFFLGRPGVALETHSADGFTRKYLLGLHDERKVETVLMRYTGRVTACISSQVGCAMGCVFCATGQMGFGRHLSPGEIVGQALHVQRELRHIAISTEAVGPVEHAQTRLRNIVLMGMGEPLHNYESVMTAIDILRDANGLALGAKKITLSTVGVVPGIIRLADERRSPHLAVSLHAATQEERAALVPTAHRWPLDELIEACRYYTSRMERRIFFEWTLIEGRNDSVDSAHSVGRLLRDIPAQVNLIPLNPTLGYDGQPTHAGPARRFQDVLSEYGLPSTVRQRRGIDIAAGCGQLAVAQRRGQRDLSARAEAP